MNKENLIKRLEQESIKGLELYIKDMRSQEECAGYIDGFDEAIELVKKFTLCAVSQHRELLEDYQHFIDWNEEHDRKASTSERIESFIASNCG